LGGGSGFAASCSPALLLADLPASAVGPRHRPESSDVAQCTDGMHEVTAALRDILSRTISI
jgi:hypothetical protein